jgi:hypothetical protein
MRPVRPAGLALSLNQVAGVSGQFIGLVVGFEQDVLADRHQVANHG